MCGCIYPDTRTFGFERSRHMFFFNQYERAQSVRYRLDKNLFGSGLFEAAAITPLRWLRGAACRVLTALQESRARSARRLIHEYRELTGE
jgi:hypothetical protein